MNEETVFMVTSGFGYNTKQPYVQIVVKAWDTLTQMSPGNARELAANLLQAAEAAEQDAFVISFAQERVGMGMQEAANLLSEYRDWREKQLADK